MDLLNEAKDKVDDKMKHSAFLTGAIVLAVAGVICRALGVIFRVPLTNIVGNFGMGLYQMVFPLYALLLIISSAGFPVAVSKMVAKEKVSGNMGECKKILRNALVLLGGIGLIVSILFVVFSHSIAKLQGNADVGIIYIAVAPSVFLVCIISAYRGYFQGLQNMIPTALSQIIEQLVKITAGIVLALLLVKVSVVWAVFGAILAVTISETVALVFLIIVYIKSGKGAKEKESKETKSSAKLDKALMGKILKQSLPITLMASVFPLILVFDSMVIINLLTAAGNDNETATQLFGIQSGAVHTLINLPAVLGVALATAVVPTVTSLLKQKKTDELREKCAFAVKLIFVLSVFFVGFFIAFSGHIIDLLYHNAFKDNAEHFEIARNLLKIESAMIVLMGISQVFTAQLQASDRSKYPLIALGIGGAAKVAFELAFITTPVGIYAVSISNVLCFLIAAVINTVYALRTVGIKFQLGKTLVRALALVGIYAAALLIGAVIIPDNRWWIILFGGISSVLYVALIWALRIFDKGELWIFKKFGSDSK